MPDATPARLPLDQVLDETLAAMFSRLRAEPTPQALLSLVDQLEEAHRGARVGAESRAVGESHFA